MKYFLIVAIIGLCVIIPRVRLFLMVLIFGVTGPDGDRARPNPIDAWRYAGVLAHQRRRK